MSNIGGTKQYSGLNKLLKNTVMLYVLQFSTYFFSFITVPYQTRIMGPEIYGKLGLAAAITVYFQLIIDFGFMLSATAEVTKARENKAKLSSIFSNVTYSKILFICLSFIILNAICIFIPYVGNNYILYNLFLLSTSINSLIPDYLYRGLEMMGAITVRTVIIKFFFTLMIFVFLKNPSDYYYVPLLTLIGNMGAVIGSFYHLKTKIRVTFVKISIIEIIKTIKESSTFFYSRIATTVYSVSNTVILGILDPIGSNIGFYTSADKLINTGKTALSPISDSIYPYMMRTKDYKLIKRILLIVMPIIITSSIIVFINAEQICVLIFGPEFLKSAYVLRALIPIIVFTLPNYILGFPTLGSMGLAIEANKSIIVGSTVHIICIIVLLIFGKINMVSLAILTSISELVILIYRIIKIIQNRRLLRMS